MADRERIPTPMYEMPETPVFRVGDLVQIKGHKTVFIISRVDPPSPKNFWHNAIPEYVELTKYSEKKNELKTIYIKSALVNHYNDNDKANAQWPSNY